jgi:hypothetical protein
MEEVRNVFKILVGKSEERTLCPRVVDISTDRVRQLSVLNTVLNHEQMSASDEGFV